MCVNFKCSLLGLMNEHMAVRIKDVNSVGPSVTLVSPA